MSDSKYFTTTKKGEIYELKAELQSDKQNKKQDAVKKVIASMTVGKDVSALFPDVVNCMQTGKLELKKLVYLYLMNYAKSQPDLAILAVNTFVKDCSDPNPLIRALAVRTMGCIRVDRITEYLCEPLRQCLKDDDPYVRKTAAVCVAKLHDINAELVEEQGFLDTLKDLLSDSNPMVVANAVAALSEINENSSKPIFALNAVTLNKLLTALNECTEWGQIFILDSLATYSPSDSREAEGICERVTPRLQHANAAVVLSTTKVLMKYMEVISNEVVVATLTKKLAPPLVTLLSSEAEIQYVALRNISLIVQKRPDILKNEMKVFFVKYNDPIYVKIEKLDIIIRLAADHNITQVLTELKEYATEVDVDFVRKSVRAIGRCAIKIETATQRCINALLELIQTKVNYVVQEAIVVIKDIFRKYPNKYESIIATLCENLDTLDEPEAKASMIWIIGEYADRIDNADELLESFLESYHDENTQVQLQLLTAIVKLFLKKPTNTQDLVQRVLTFATQNSDNPDLRDRGYIYWRLLSTDPAAAKAVVLSEKPLISDEMDMLDPPLLDELICNIATLASVYHKPPSTFVSGKTAALRLPHVHSVESTEQNSVASQQPNDVLAQQPAPVSAAPVNDLLGDLLSLDLDCPPSNQMQQHPQQHMGHLGVMGGDNKPLQQMAMAGGMSQHTDAGGMSSGANDLLGLLGGGTSMGSPGGTNIFSSLPSSSADVMPKTMWLSANKAKGLEIHGTFARRNGQIFMDMTLANRAMQSICDFAIQLNKNSFGLSPPSSALQVPSLPANQTADVSVLLNGGNATMRMDPINNIQVAIKNNIGVYYFATPVPLNVLFIEDGLMERGLYLNTWQEIASEQSVIVNCNMAVQALEDKLTVNNVFTVAKRNVDNLDVIYASLKFINGMTILLEFTISGQGQVKVAAKSTVVDLLAASLATMRRIITA